MKKPNILIILFFILFSNYSFANTRHHFTLGIGFDSLREIELGTDETTVDTNDSSKPVLGQRLMANFGYVFQDTESIFVEAGAALDLLGLFSGTATNKTAKADIDNTETNGLGLPFSIYLGIGYNVTEHFPIEFILSAKSQNEITIGYGVRFSFFDYTSYSRVYIDLGAETGMSFGSSDITDETGEASGFTLGKTNIKISVGYEVIFTV